MKVFKEWERGDSFIDTVLKVRDGLDVLGFDGSANGILEELNKLAEELLRLRAASKKERGPDRRIERQDMFKTGSDLHLVKTLEAVSRIRCLSQDEEEVLKSAQAKIRIDGSANGRRSGGDRRNDAKF